ncbi:MAG: hypothetical protein AAFP19_19580, partial [Bacteroidota bacterium]
MNVQKEYKTILLPLIKGFPVLAIFIAIAVFLALRYLSYATPLYQAVGSVRIDNRDHGISDFELFSRRGRNGMGTNFLTEVEVIRSKSLVQKVFKKLDFSVSYYRLGRVRQTEMYSEESPFIITYLNNNDDFYHRSFYLEYKGEGEFGF